MMALMGIVLWKDPTLSHCKKCGAATVHYSKPRNSFEKVVRFIPSIGIYRCHTCAWRGFLIELEIGGRIFFKILVSLALVLVSATVIYYILKTFMAKQ